MEASRYCHHHMTNRENKAGEQQGECSHFQAEGTETQESPGQNGTLPPAGPTLKGAFLSIVISCSPLIIECLWPEMFPKWMSVYNPAFQKVLPQRNAVFLPRASYNNSYKIYSI